MRLDDYEHAVDFHRVTAHGPPPPGADPAAALRAYEVQCFREEYMAATAAAHLVASDGGGWLALLAGERHVRGRRGLPARTARRLAAATSGARKAPCDFRGAFVVVPRTAPPPAREDAMPGTEVADYLWYVARDAGDTAFREDRVNRAPAVLTG